LLAKLPKDRPSLDSDDLKNLFEQLKPILSDRTRLVEPETCEYVIDDAVLSIMRDLAKSLSTKMNVGMESGVKVGQFAFGDFRAFWSALLALIQIHILAHELACEGDVTKFAIRTSVIRKPRAAMASFLGSVARIAPEAAEFILKGYIYDPRINGKSRICQPFIPIAGDDVCVSSSLVAFLDFERHFFKLLHRSPSLLPFSASIDNQKEPIAIRYISALFPPSEYAIKDCVPVPKTDIDLLVYDRRTGFTLVIQHKWVTAPETPDESSSNDEFLGNDSARPSPRPTGCEVSVSAWERPNVQDGVGTNVPGGDQHCPLVTPLIAVEGDALDQTGNLLSRGPALRACGIHRCASFCHEGAHRGRRTSPFSHPHEKR
jgi:hypothetical protein